MEKSEIEAIRERHQRRCDSLVRTSEHFEQGAYGLRHEANVDVADLLAEVERLQWLVSALNPCPNCHTFNLVRREGAPLCPNCRAHTAERIEVFGITAFVCPSRLAP